MSENAPQSIPDNVVVFGEEKATSPLPGSTMKSALVEQASEIVPDPLILINLVSKRVRQLNSGRTPLIDRLPSMGAADVALTEIIEGKLKLIEGKAES